MQKVKIQITEEEWVSFPQAKRKRIIELMDSYGYSTVSLKALERECVEPTIEDIFKQFYGDEA